MLIIRKFHIMIICILGCNMITQACFVVLCVKMSYVLWIICYVVAWCLPSFFSFPSALCLFLWSIMCVWPVGVKYEFSDS